MPQEQDTYTLFTMPAKEEAEESKAGWAIPWSDLMLVMFILFLVLYAFHARETLVNVSLSPADNWSQASSENTRDLNLQGLYADAKKSLEPEHAPLQVSKTKQGSVIISLYGEDFFKPGSRSLNPEARSHLNRIAEITSQAQGKIVVAGFAQNREKNLLGNSSLFELSSMRAARVAEQLAHSSTLKKENLVIQGIGVPKPQVPGNSPSNRDRNRRVEIRLKNAL
ncbi:MAG: OmpA family protein [Desulfohalobiaceae bacterium]